MPARKVRFVSVGLGGYARTIVDRLVHFGAGADAALELSAVFEPDHVTHAEFIAQLRGRGIRVVDRYDALLDMKADACWLPLPIHLHRPFAEQALAAGKAVMIEKPAAAVVEDVDALIAARDRARLPVAVGFQDIYDDTTALLKRRLLDGEIGRLRCITLIGCWPRPFSYYARNRWAGRLRCDGQWVLDSPANNALAHFINLGMFLAGDGLNRSAKPLTIEAELYRVYPIESYDTCALRITLAGDVQFIVLLTHAGQTKINPILGLRGDAGTAEWHAFSHMILDGRRGRQTVPLFDGITGQIVPRFATMVREPDAENEPYASLEQARGHTVVVNGAAQAQAILTVDGPHVDARREGEDTHRRIIGIEALFAACVKGEQLPHETGLAAWTQLPGACDVRHLPRFDGPAATSLPKPVVSVRVPRRELSRR